MAMTPISGAVGVPGNRSRIWVVSVWSPVDPADLAAEWVELRPLGVKRSQGGEAMLP